MKIDINSLKELTYYLNSFQGVLDNLPLDKQIYKEGATAGQIVFHAFQSVNYWIRVIILEQTYLRDRSTEYTRIPTLQETQQSLVSALEACEMLPMHDVSAEKILAKPITVDPTKFTVITVSDALLHVTTHTAEHWAELHLLGEVI